MKFAQRALALTLCLSLTGCGLNFGKKLTQQELDRIAPLTNVAEDNQYRYAFSAVVKSNQGETKIENFSIDLVSGEEKVQSIINPLGNKDGVFHISRKTQNADSLLAFLPVMVSAPGYESQIQWLEVGQDCQGNDCEGTRPQTIYLQPKKSQVKDSFETSQNFTPRAATMRMASQGTSQIFQSLSDSNRIDEELQRKLATSNNGEKIENVIVMLNENGIQSQSQVENLVGTLISQASPASNQGINSLLNGVNPNGNVASGVDLSQLIGLFASGSPEVAAAMLAVKFLLPYVQKIATNLASQSDRPFAKILAAFVNNEQLPNLLIGVIGGQIKGQNFLASMMPILSSIFPKPSDPNSQNNGLSPQIQNPSIPFSGLLAQLLGGGNTQSGLLGQLLGQLIKPKPVQPEQGQGSSNSNESMQEIAKFIQPLVQGLLGDKNKEIAGLFNQLVQGGNPLSILADYQSQNEIIGNKNFYKILPYLQPLVQGLQGEKSQNLAAFLKPFLDNQDPAKALTEFGNNPASFSPQKLAEIAGAIFPGLGNVVNQNMPSKQLFAAQIMNGLIQGDFKGAAVEKDLPGTRGVMISARARDLFKIAQLPNVAKIMTAK